MIELNYFTIERSYKNMVFIPKDGLTSSELVDYKNQIYSAPATNHDWMSQAKVTATGGDLQWILENFTNLPYMKGQNVVTWVGETATFIIMSLYYYERS